MRNRKLILTLGFVLAAYSLFAQDTADTVAGEGWMISERKIIVVGAVVLTILIGLIIYVVRLDKKISRLEAGKKD